MQTETDRILHGDPYAARPTAVLYAAGLVRGPRSIDPHLGPNRATRRELAREARLDRKHLRKAVADLEHRLRRGGR